MTTGVIIQARMGSTRLPGKVLMRIDQQNNILDFILKQLKNCKNVDRMIVATTLLKEDDIIEKELKKHGVLCFRGNPVDVLDRYYQCAKLNSISTIVRITGDCPLIDPTIVDKMLVQFRSGVFDYMSNAVVRTFPIGLDTEIFTFDALERAWISAKKDYEREHVTTYLYSNPNIFKIFHYRYHKDYSSFRCTVDEKEDLILIRKIISKISKRPILLDDIIDLLTREAELTTINKNVKHRHISQLKE